MRFIMFLVAVAMVSCGSSNSKKNSSPTPKDPSGDENSQPGGNQGNENGQNKNPTYYDFMARCLSSAREIQKDSGHVLRATWTCSSIQSSQSQPQLLSQLKQWGNENCPLVIEIEDAVQYNECVIEGNRPIDFISENTLEVEETRGYVTMCGEIDNYQAGELKCNPR